MRLCNVFNINNIKACLKEILYFPKIKSIIKHEKERIIKNKFTNGIYIILRAI
jgi:hypothetical protein